MAVTNKNGWRLSAQKDEQKREFDELVAELDELRQSEELFCNLVMEAPLGILVRDGGVIRFANNAIAELLEILPEEAQTESLEETLGWIHPDDRAFVADLIRRRVANASDLPPEYNVRVVTSTGKTRWVTMFVRALKTEGTQSTVVTCMTDITDRKLAEDAVIRERDRAQLYLDMAGVMFVAIDAFGNVSLINQKGCEVLGYAEDEIVGKNWFDHFIPDRIKEGLLEVSRSALSGDLTSAVRHENPVLTKSGEERLIAWHNAVIRDAEGNITGHLSSGEDITDRKRLEAQLIQAQKMEAAGQLAGGVAHDMNNVLTMIMAAASILEEEINPEDELAEDVETIILACRRGRDLTKALLGFARKGLSVHEQLKMAEILSEVVNLLERAAYQRVTIESNVSEQLHDVKGDRSQITQVVMNVCLNAIDAIGQRGRLVITADNVDLAASDLDSIAAGDYVCLRIIDDGCGMSEEVKQRAFEPFFTTKPVGKGTGLGLAIAFGVIRSHGGDLLIDTELGRGTTVSIYLPAAESGDFDLAPPEVPFPEDLSATVLVVDDEPQVRSVAERILKKAGCRVLTAADGIEAVEVYRAKGDEIDLVLLDLVMPNMDGADAFVALRDMDPDVTVVVTSGYVEDDRKTALFSHAAVSEFVQKPYTASELLAHIVRALEQP